ncbi:MAG: hypothetical protein U0324_46475 [Polyangiales bacterium]
MPPPPARPSVPMLAFSAAVLALGVTVAVKAVRQGGAPRGAGAGRCEVTATVSVTADPLDRPTSVVRGPSLAWALVLAPVPGRSDGAVRVRAIRVPDDGAAEVAWSGEASSAAAVSNLVRTRDGAAFAVARGRAVTAYELSASGPARERPFPRGESPPGRDAVTPALALAADGDGHLAALARWPAPWGTRRISTRDVREGGPMTPRRRDAFARPDLAVVGDVALVAQEHRAGTFVGGGPEVTRAELAVLDAAPAHPDLLATLSLPRDGGASSMPRVAPADPSSPASGALVTWRDERGIAAARAVRDARGAWAPAQTMRVSDDRRDGAPHDVGSARGRCGAVAACRDGDAVALRAFDLAEGRAGTPVRVALPAGAAVAGVEPRVRVERAGDRTVPAVDTAAGVRAFDVAVGDDCAATLAPVALPSGFAGARLAGSASSAEKIQLVATPDAPDADETRARFAALPAGGGVRAEPAATTLGQGAAEVGLFEGGVPVVAGRARGSVMLLRVGDPGDDDGPGEDLLLRAMRGVDFALTASAERHRVWVADVSGDEETPFGPARAVVVHSAIDTLEDGPRTEVRTATVPEADFLRMTLGAPAPDGSRGATWSGASGDGCVPGAWASRHDRDDRGLPVASGAWQWMTPLVPEASRACGDRVHAAVWRGDVLHAAVTGERFGARLVTAAPGGEARATAFDERPEARVRQPAVDALGDGLFAAWLDGEARAPALRCRVFSREGAARTEVIHLGEVAAAPSDAAVEGALPVSAGEGGVAVLLRTTHGPRLARVSCGAP